MNDPDLQPTEKIEVDSGEDTLVEAPEWSEDTELEDHPVLNPVDRVFERLRQAGVRARDPSSDEIPQRNRRHDEASAQRFERGLVKLQQGDLDGAFNTFTKLLQERPQSTRLWIFVRAISQSKS